MSLYCLCKGQNYRNHTIGEAAPMMEKAGVVLDQRMEIIRMGAEQFIEDKASGAVSRHYPNVDLHRCPVCGTTIARE